MLDHDADLVDVFALQACAIAIWWRAAFALPTALLRAYTG